MRCRSLAEMPVRRVEISKIARNHVRRLARLLQHRTGRERRLMAAFHIFESGAIAEQPDARALALFTGRLAAPAVLDLTTTAVRFGPKTLKVIALIVAAQRKLKSRPGCVSAVTKKNTRSLHLRQRTFLSSGRPALDCPVGRQAVSVARQKRVLRQRTFEQFTTRLFPRSRLATM